MSDQHTKGQLTHRGYGVLIGGPMIELTNGSAQGQVAMACVMDEIDHIENARRLAAAWNACEGMPTEHIEALSGCGSIGDLHASELAAARALLRESLETFDDNPSEDHEIAERIRSYLDASDKQGGAS